MTKPLRVLLAVVIVAGVTISSSLAATVPLSDLLDGSDFVSGSKTFNNFTYTTKPGSDMPSAESVTVTDIDDGIRFQGAFVDHPGGDASDVLITFDVQVNDGPGIYRASMSANPAVFNGPGLASVTETFLPMVDDHKLVIYDFGGGDDKLFDSMTFDPALAVPLSVQKDLILHAMGDTGAVTMSFIDQTFEQVPEPTGLVLLIGSLLGLGVLRRKTR